MSPSGHGREDNERFWMARKDGSEIAPHALCPRCVLEHGVATIRGRGPLGGVVSEGGLLAPLPVGPTHAEARRETKMEEAKESHVGTTEERIQTLNEGIADEVLGEDTPEPEILSLKIKKIVMDKRTGRIIFLAEDGREFARSASSMRKFDVADEVSIERGMLGSMFLVRQDGLRIKVKELD